MKVQHNYNDKELNVDLIDNMLKHQNFINVINFLLNTIYKIMESNQFFLIIIGYFDLFKTWQLLNRVIDWLNDELIHKELSIQQIFVP
jgi:hypothetical protein